tara:strand:- start:10116 stop:11117 length:1002 start_codon:yes stop_codon:yes gene_type:complete
MLNIQQLKKSLKIPVIAAPLFIISNPETVVAQCCSGIIGSFPALNARGEGELERWIEIIEKSIEKRKLKKQTIAPYAVNQIVHSSNTRLEADLEICIKKKVPIIITSLRAPGRVVEAVHSYGGFVFHDVINLRHAEKAIEAGVDGLILVSAGAGGHAGTINPFALVTEVKKIFKGTIILAGAISNGNHILAAEALGADFVYMGTKFICSSESPANNEYKKMIIESSAQDIIYTNFFTGIYGSYLKRSAEKAGYRGERKFSLSRLKLFLELFLSKKFKRINFSSFEKLGNKAWKDIWSAGQGVGSIESVELISEIVDTLAIDYKRAREKLQQND